MIRKFSGSNKNCFPIKKMVGKNVLYPCILNIKSNGALDKRDYLMIIFLIYHQNHMLSH